jgi:carbon monoxide dehydrogenase subunit G
MPGIETDIAIDAPPDTVWAVLTDFAGYHRWKPYVLSVEGGLEPGSMAADLIGRYGARIEANFHLFNEGLKRAAEGRA